MTPPQFKDGRHTLGLSTAQLATVFKVSGGRTVRRWESGDTSIPGPAQVLMDLLLLTTPPRTPADPLPAYLRRAIKPGPPIA